MTKQIEQDRGSRAAYPVVIGTDLFGIYADSVEQVYDSYNKLGNADAKKQFLDDVRLGIERVMPKGWFQVYAALDVTRQEEWYWNGLGYKTFDDYLRGECGFAFSEFERLEKLYLFATKCCPNLFKISKEDLTRIMAAWKKADAVRELGDNQHGGCATKNLQHTLAKPSNGEIAKEVELAKQTPDFQEGYSKRGSTDRFYRFRRLKRDAPRIAQSVLDGKYMKQRKNGEWFVDLDAAELDAINRYGAKFRAPYKASRRKPLTDKIIALLVQTTDEEWNAVVDWMEKSREHECKSNKKPKR